MAQIEEQIGTGMDGEQTAKVLDSRCAPRPR